MGDNERVNGSRAQDVAEPGMPFPGTPVSLRDGAYLLRPLHPGDEAALLAFFRSHTEETIYYRYGFALRDMTEARARALVGVDQSKDPAFGVFGVGTTDAGVLHAVGRYYLEQDRGGLSGEVAFVTRESKRRCGMGRLLLETLIATAIDRGLHRLWGQVLPDNIPMLRLFQKLGFKRRGLSEGSVRMELKLQ